jgi:hypothetical protein
MTTDQMNTLCEETKKAVEVNDLEALVKIYKIILQDQKSTPYKFAFGEEFFLSYLTPELFNQIQQRIEKNI